uniref:FBA_2 domain-containing protein n=2 Tax=Caenorhabditis tropicalis TaxID=1561998 RepID=A0A1I7U2B2_9PELO
MERMIQFPNWKYFILMQNHDVIGKSVYEISRIFEIFGGANDVDIAKGNIVERFRWDLESLDLFRDVRELRIVKGSVQGSLSREAVDWIVNQVNPMVFLADGIKEWTKWSDESECESGFVRHSVCVIGIEEFSNIARMPNIMFNKMMPSFDNSVIECTAELLYNRTFLGQDDYPLEEEYYSNMINVRCLQPSEHQ